MNTVFACLFAGGTVCFSLYVLEMIQGRVSISTKWKDLTVDQWIFYIGSFCMPVGLVGLVMTK